MAVPRWIAIAAVVFIAAGVLVLSIVAIDRTRSDGPPDAAAPVPTFVLGAATPTPTATAAPVALAPPRDAERFLTEGDGALWRGVAGACGGAQPLIERSSDGGQVWSDVTPRYLGITQLAALLPFAGTEAEIIASAGEGCDAQGLRTFTQGGYWESFADVLPTARYVSITDPATVVVSGAPIAAPCANARGLGSSGDVVALVCDEQAWLLTGTAWTALVSEPVVAVAVDGADVVVAEAGGEECAGIRLSRFAVASPAAPGVPVACADEADAAPAAALAVVEGSILLWAGDQVLRFE